MNMKTIPFPHSLQHAAMAALAMVLATAAPEFREQEWQWFPAASAAHEDEGGGHSGGHGGGRGGHEEDSHGDDHEGHTPGPRGGGHHGAGAGGGRSHEVARGAGKAVEERIFRGQRPVWAQEGIPEVELGRLNVSRAPSHVLARAEAEALATYQLSMQELYGLTAEEAAALLQTRFREVSRYDSPLQNLALYKDVMTFGSSQLPIAPASRLDLAAILLGSASDKNIPVTEDTVIALNRILGLTELSAGERSVLADKSERVREAIFIGHGPDSEH